MTAFTRFAPRAPAAAGPPDADNNRYDLDPPGGMLRSPGQADRRGMSEAVAEHGREQR